MFVRHVENPFLRGEGLLQSGFKNYLRAFFKNIKIRTEFGPAALSMKGF
jgi:hypothetical protein